MPETETTIRLRRLLRAAYHELGNARDLALGATRWNEGAAEAHWTHGSGARLLHNIEQALNLEAGVPVANPQGDTP